VLRLVSWAGGTSELLSRPLERGRLRGLGQVTARTHGTRFWVALWAAGAAAGVIALIPVFAGDPPVPGNEVIHRLSGISFMACGLVAWRRRPDSAVGPMLTVAGFGVVLSEILTQIDSALAFTAALLLGEVWIVVYVALILSFVSGGGRLQSTVDHVLVGMFFVALFVLQFALMLFLDVEDNLLLVRPDAGIAEALTKVQWAILIVASLAVAFVTGARWRSASQPRRRTLLPSLGGSLSGILFAAWLTTLLLESPVIPLVWILNTALLTVPAALLWGLLRSRLARGGLADLFRELATRRGVQLEAGLAKTLGDPSLVLAYRVPGGRSYIDGAGQPVAPPAPGGDRTSAPVERDGRELGMLVYDAALDDDPELVEAVAAPAAIALDDARLQAESAGRLAELRASRERIVAAGDAERRRLERNLHDGAQQRLVSVALQLRMIQSRIREDPALAEELVSSAATELSQSLEELRELARGIHPAVLNHGLRAALKSLASRASVPTTIAFECPERLPEQVELTAYFVACEALANVGKYAGATETTVRVSRRDGLVVVEIDDDGVGGADESAGTGLRGLADRVAALDGTLRILSPPGGGTLVTAELPCAS
jgi:signal transduction histidine kinase